MIDADLPDWLLRYTRQPVLLGRSSAQVYRLQRPGVATLYLKSAASGAGHALGAEHDRLRWLRGRVAVPRVVAFQQHAGYELLVTRALAGVDASAVPTSRRKACVVGVASALRELHAQAIHDCPFDLGARRQIEQAHANVAAGCVDETDFDDERRGRRALDLLQDLERDRPENEDRVLTHGDTSLPNLIFDGTRFSGFVDCGRVGVADRYQDLAVAARSIDYNYGSAFVQPFFAAYGLTQPDQAKLAWYRLLDEFF